MLKLLIDKKSSVNKQLSEIKKESEQENRSVTNPPESIITESAARLKFNKELNQPSQSFRTTQSKKQPNKRQIYNTTEIKLLPHTLVFDSSQSRDLPINRSKAKDNSEKGSDSCKK